jgi:hypothetical protein
VKFFDLQDILLQDEIQALNFLFFFHFAGVHVCRGRQDCALRGRGQMNRRKSETRPTILFFISKETYYYWHIGLLAVEDHTYKEAKEICKEEKETYYPWHVGLLAIQDNTVL